MGNNPGDPRSTNPNRLIILLAAHRAFLKQSSVKNHRFYLNHKTGLDFANGVVARMRVYARLTIRPITNVESRLAEQFAKTNSSLDRLFYLSVIR